MKSFDTAESVARACSYALRSPLHASRAFTLLEVMLVIGIMAVLAALLFPVVIGSTEKARRKQANAEVSTILTAIKAYRQEYGKWPAQRQSARDTTYIISNYCVIQPLLGTNWNEFNPKEKIFLDLQISTNRMDYMGNYLDPWLVPYVICMDEDGNNSLAFSNEVTYSATNAGRPIYTNLLVTNYYVTNVSAGAASLGGTTNTLPLNSWQEIQ